MDLRVTAGDLESFARLVRRAADDTTEARAYVGKHGAIGFFDQGLFTRLIDLHGELEETVTQTLRRLQELLAASADEVVEAARYYRRTDLAEAAKMDAVYRGPR
ncbi:hypothetical protein FHS39_001996 [Streptomyces olivoverticillatus]|uniref:Excreted virulence factor EspC (Type VII ESX diderm) n=1 Tax=Streptomyces olivoverticillatus TaxID=66427 RepID=A0A7W7PLM5_9ACTN|nr:hypothetical protein [Streptomyces olivoverticillatus]MBB4892985.1 hypothetical protein [Streptomyces olivoverticillatus]